MSDQDDPIITITDVRRVFCVNGSRKWAKSQGIDFADFIRNGLPASQLLGRGDDHLIERVIAAKKEAENG
ncbi:hypothetical protein RCCWILLIS_47 [Rhodobacter phage RcCWillis]|nr:hypothetical protein RCCWILLIS_47 [Rhodobacter phage RcCWillis]